jgi:hypothetical protein
MAALDQQLVQRPEGLIRLLTPPFDLAESSGSLSRFVAVQPVAVGRRYHACGGPRLPTLAEYAPSRHRGQFR